LLVERAIGAGRRHDDRAAIRLAEQFHSRVELADIDQPPLPQLEFLEALAVGAQGGVVVDARRHVAEMRRRQVLVGHQLEVEDVERFARAADQLIERARTPDHRVGQALDLLGEGRRAAEQRTARQELQQPAPARQRVWAHRFSLSRKVSQASICDLATNSLGWWACEMSPGPQITVGMPWPRKMPASVP